MCLHLLLRLSERKTESVHTADKTIDQIYDEEVASSGFKTDKRLFPITQYFASNIPK